MAIWLVTRKESDRVDVQLTHLATNETGIVQVSLLITNGSKRSFNILDGISGKPVFMREDPFARRVWTEPPSNSWKLNLMPGQSIQTTIFVTNPLPRYRFLVSLTPHKPTLQDAFVNFKAERNDKSGRSIASDLKPASPWIPF